MFFFKILESIVVLAIVLVFFTEVIYPIIFSKPLFGSFRSKKEDPPKNIANEDLNKELQNAKLKVKEVKEVQTKVDEFHKSADQLKKESDDLLK